MPRPPSILSLLTCLIVLTANTWMLQGGRDAPVQDCDEVFNYLDPLHYALWGIGQQTWEYSPAYALRSWFYIEIHAVGIRIANVMGMTDALTLLDALRLVLVFVNLVGEARLCHALGEKFKSSHCSWICALFLGYSSGMGHARRALLPSSTCMMCFTYALGEWLMDRHTTALACGAFAVLVSWPFAALPFVPIGMHALYRRGLFHVVFVGIVSLVTFGLFPAVVDSWYYGKPVWPTLQMVLYNALGASGGGAHLYGVEPMSYYPKNLVLNFNVVVIIFVLSMVTTSQARWMYLLIPVLLHCGLFQCMPHKEERFLFVVYPAVCASAAVCLSKLGVDGGSGGMSLPRRVVLFVTLLIFVVLCASRNMALGRLDGPAWVLRNGFNHTRFMDAGTTPTTKKKICYGREWYRFPSSFYLPLDTEIAYVESNFNGILPQRFQDKSRGGFSHIPPHMNDMNRKEPSRYVTPLDACTFAVDSDEPWGEADVLRPFAQPNVWKPVECREFADMNASRQPFRSFAVLWDPFRGVVKRKYCLFERL